MLRHKLEASNADNQHVRLMNVSELEKCLKEALYTDTVGCPESILYDISQATYHPGFLDRILKAIWKCIHSRASKVRRIQKGLSLLHYLVINGSERCISDILLHMDDINSLHKLKFSQANREIGALIKEKAVKLTSLICDTEALHAKRKYTASIRDRFVSVGSNNGKVETDVLHKPVYVVDEGRSASGPEFVRSQLDAPENRGFLSRFFRGKHKPAVVNVGLYGLPDANGAHTNSLYPGSTSLDQNVLQNSPYGQYGGYSHPGYIGQYSHYARGDDYTFHYPKYGQDSHYGYSGQYMSPTLRRDLHGYQERRPVYRGYGTTAPIRKTSSSSSSGSTFKKYSSSSSSSDSDSSYDEHIKHGKYVPRGRRTRRQEDHRDVFDDPPVTHLPDTQNVDHYDNYNDNYNDNYGNHHGHYNDNYGDHHYGNHYGQYGDHYGNHSIHYGAKYGSFEPRYASTQQDMPSVHRQYLSRGNGTNPFNRAA